MVLLILLLTETLNCQIKELLRTVVSVKSVYCVCTKVGFKAVFKHKENLDVLLTSLADLDHNPDQKEAQPVQKAAKCAIYQGKTLQLAISWWLVVLESCRSG